MAAPLADLTQRLEALGQELEDTRASVGVVPDFDLLGDGFSLALLAARLVCALVVPEDACGRTRRHHTELSALSVGHLRQKL